MSEQLLSTKAQFEVVWKLMGDLGIGKITVSFNGEGDSGDITDISAEPVDAQPAYKHGDPVYHEAINEWSKRASDLQAAMTGTYTGIVRDIWEGNVIYEPDHKTTELNLYDLVRALSDPIVNNLDEDWVNNDGGFGEVIWDPADQTIHVDLSIRIVSTEGYEYDYDKYGEEVEA